jgi:isocitrate dehydrogenase (NAD+)
MFEAIHGTAPRMIEDGLQDYVNPMSIFKAAEMMLRHLGYTDIAERLRSALEMAQREEAPKVTGFRDGNTTKELTEYIYSYIF